MSDHDKLTVLLPPDLARSVREALDGERYVVESDVVIDALNDWKIKQAMRADKIVRLRELVSEGLASGSQPISADEFANIKREGRARLAGRTAGK
ncbi:MAG: type II toxin-antitoxin system ParD family antitoxin [Xanthobacteraceae bacterium]|nr:type II toxin-antitoxin system ParD family antitoxin [Xanthobacteraceae bacterium]